MRGNPSTLWWFGARQGSIPAHAGKPARRQSPATVPGVYPRACGETSSVPAMDPLMPGLSPRMRGNLLRPDSPGFPRGSIPAHAGKPSGRAARPGPGRVYPRACGETTSSGAQNTAEKGLSPRMRGNRILCAAVCVGLGSIPAHAGKPIGNLGASRHIKVYPRACGETSCLAAGY